MTRISFTLLTAGVLTLMGCDGGSSSAVGGKRVLARNVIVGPSAQGNVSALGVSAAADDVDPNLKVLAQNVEVTNTGNALASANLQSALDNELAVNLTTLLPGTTWTIQNLTSDSTYKDLPGEITFTADKKITVSGHFGAGGLVSGSVAGSYCDIPLSVSYEVLGNSVLYVSAHVKGRTGNYENDQSATPIVIARTKDQLTLMGGGGCGSVGESRVSILTRKP